MSEVRDLTTVEKLQYHYVKLDLKDRISNNQRFLCFELKSFIDKKLTKHILKLVPKIVAEIVKNGYIDYYICGCSLITTESQNCCFYRNKFSLILPKLCKTSNLCSQDYLTIPSKISKKIDIDHILNIQLMINAYTIDLIFKLCNEKFKHPAINYEMRKNMVVVIFDDCMPANE